MKSFLIASLLLAASTVWCAQVDTKVDLNVTPGVNFNGLDLRGTVTLIKVDAIAAASTVKVNVIDSVGDRQEVVSLAWKGFGSYSVDKSVSGLKSGEDYTLEVLVMNGGETVAESRCAHLPTAKKFDGVWIDEDADSFDGIRSGTGTWDYRVLPDPEAEVEEDAPVIGKSIKINAWQGPSVYFDPTNRASAVGNSSIREFTFTLCSMMAGYTVSFGDYPQARAGDIAGVTIACDDKNGRKLHFSVFNPEDRSWQMLPQTTAVTNQVYSFTVAITYPGAGKETPAAIAYYLNKANGAREQIALLTPASGVKVVSDAYPDRVRIAGCGYVRDIAGSCYDAHLAMMGGAEYWTAAEAVGGYGDSGKVLAPLWYSTFSPIVSKGIFGVRDPNGWLSFDWPLGYVVKSSKVGDISYYDFFLSDNWIDWAKKDDVEISAGKWTVKSANGLAWLAQVASTNDMNGEIALARDITNLNEHVWTPIRDFHGTFDGNNRKLCGLTDKGTDVCWTNTLPLSAYGLFGTASDSVFRNVTFEDVSITNSADAVASLLGCSLGSLVLENVTVASGTVAGEGRYVGGIVGYIGRFTEATLSENKNAATVAAIAGDSTDGVNAAGIANLGSGAGSSGKITIVNNENKGAIESTIVSKVGGGNVAQVLAGSDSATKFDSVNVTGNVGTGDVSRVISLNHGGASIGELPIVNLAAETTRQSNNLDYKRFIEANDSESVVIDPYLKTPRMTACLYQDGATNYAGRINDLITLSKPGDTIEVNGSYELWSPIVVDRSVTLKLNDNILDMVFDDYLLNVSPSATATLKTGTISYPEGKRDIGGGSVSLTGIVESKWTCDYWERTLMINGEYLQTASLPVMKLALSSGSSISVPEDSAYSIDAESGTLNINGEKYVDFAALGYTVRAEKDGEDTIYIVDVIDVPEAAPTISLALAPNGGTSKVVVKGAKADREYCLQAVETLSEAWDKTTDKWISVPQEGDDLVFEVDTSKPSGFYRIRVRNK